MLPLAPLDASPPTDHTETPVIMFPSCIAQHLLRLHALAPMVPFSAILTASPTPRVTASISPSCTVHFSALLRRLHRFSPVRSPPRSWVTRLGGQLWSLPTRCPRSISPDFDFGGRTYAAPLSHILTCRLLCPHSAAPTGLIGVCGPVWRLPACFAF